MKPILYATLLAILLSATQGCSTAVHSPSPLRAIRPAADLAALGTFSDGGIVLYATEALDGYEGGDVTNTILTLAGAGTMGALGTAAIAVPGMAKGLLLGTNGILMALGLWRPLDRASADNQGSGMIREALGTYVLALIAENYCTIPSDRVTASGAQLFATTNAVIKSVNDLRMGILDLGSRSIKQLQMARSQESENVKGRTVQAVCK